MVPFHSNRKIIKIVYFSFFKLSRQLPFCAWLCLLELSYLVLLNYLDYLLYYTV